MAANQFGIRCHAGGEIDLPKEVEKLFDLAYNLWWTWNPDAVRLFSGLDPKAWSRHRNPVQQLLHMDWYRWEILLENDSFMSSYEEVTQSFDRYMASDETWFDRHHPGCCHLPIAYFSMEYGVHPILPIYSGGLGVLSGDHCKSASDLGLPFIAVGLLYGRGYFQQTIDADGQQQHTYPHLLAADLPLRLAVTRTGRPLVVEIPFPGRTVLAQVWVLQIGRIPILLLDTGIASNDPADRPITSNLYTQGREMRLCQEVVLGIGGVKALAALGIEPSVWHINEGHSALLQVERLREMVEAGQDSDSSWQRVAANTVFTTHTPVPAGNEQFPVDMVRPYLDAWSESLDQPTDAILDRGHADHGEPEQPFNMTAFAIRSSSFTNGVSELNAKVASRMWWHLFPGADSGDQVVRPVTNGVHTLTWIGNEIRTLLERHLGSPLAELLEDEVVWDRVHELDDRELWGAHLAQKRRLGRFTRSRVRDQKARHGHSPEELRAVEGFFDPKALTIGFARRFATYKRANLIFSDLHRLRNLLGNADRPVQILFAGKAHPADRPGQEVVQHIFQLSQSEPLLGRIFFLENYDMRMGRMLVQGVDVWLNTPRRPHEASGTSGQKAAMNGALNLSILDGWWPEGFDGENGWVIGGEETDEDSSQQDRSDALALYDTLEDQIVPAFFQQDERGISEEWLKRMKSSIATITPRFSSNRMVRDYTEKAYVPAAGRRSELDR